MTKVINNLFTAISILILLDLITAFDTVRHSTLLSKLRELGIVDSALDWFTSHLNDRKQFISLSGFTSTSVVT